MEPKEPEIKESKKVVTRIKRTLRVGLTLPVFFVGVIAIFSLYLSFSDSLFAPVREVVLTFWISFCVGLIGAGVYLSLLLMTEKNLKILENALTDDLFLMTFIFLLSGGFVAAVTQVSTGTLAPSGLQAVFMLGFGWLGALAGVAGTSTRVQLSQQNQKLNVRANTAEIERDSSLEGLKMENKELKEKLVKVYEELAKLRGSE